MELEVISSFFNKNVNKVDEVENFWKRLCFISSNEWHWSQEELYNTEIPFILSLLDSREEYIKEQNKKR